MDFFAHQDRARRQTRLLVLLFVLALLAIVIAVDAVVLTLLASLGNETGRLTLPDSAWLAGHAGLVTVVSLLTAGCIALASVFRIATLGSGGGRVARGLGGTRITPDTRDPLRRRLHNVVEEMAIASGVPVPEVYVLEEEPGLNAFAAGYTPGDAAIAMTRGSLETLSRNELQGVVAHEFSHVLNGDMRLNTRLLGVLFGILVISLIGRTVLNSLGRVRVRSSRSGGRGGGIALVLAIGLALAAIGYLGLFFARLIKAAVSRQREYLADASAVQFTRQTEGIAGALKKIAYGGSSLIQDADGEEVSHMLFANGLRGFLNLYATHPPIEERIRALDPRFDPDAYVRSLAKQAEAREPQAAEVHNADRAAAPAGPSQWSRLMESLLVLTPAAVSGAVGNPQERHVQLAAELRRMLPERLRQAAHSPSGAPLLIITLLLDDAQESRGRQLRRLAARFSAQHLSVIETLHSQVKALGPVSRLPLMALAYPALKQRPREQIEALVEVVDALIHSDGRVDSFEYLLSRSLLTHLRDAERPARPSTRPRLKLVNSLEALHVLFSVVARLGHRHDEEAARDAYQAGMLALLPNTVDWPRYAPPQQWVTEMDAALEVLDRLPAPAKEELIKALSVTISHDRTVTVTEAEMLRAVCAILHCPLPPFVAEDGAAQAG